MSDAQVCIEDQLEPASALARGQAFCEACTPSEPVALYGATLRGDSLVLGAYQHAAQALAKASLEHGTILRRATGGATVRAGDGIIYLALGLHQRSALMTCPKLRILNRNVRGALQGLRLLGVAAHYFGRDFISVDVRPAAYIGWQAWPDGRVVLELFVSATTSYVPAPEQLGYPAREHDPHHGKAPITLAEAGAKALDATVVEKIAAGYESAFGAQFRSITLAREELDRAGEVAQAQHVLIDESEKLSWSSPREEAIGFVSAGVSLDRSGKLDQVRLAGDFFQDAGCPASLTRTLQGVEPSDALIGRGLDAVYAQGSHELEGVRSLRTFQEAILEAVEHARAS